MKLFKSLGIFALGLAVFLTSCEEDIEPTPEPAVQFSLSANQASLVGSSTASDISPKVMFTNDTDEEITLTWHRIDNLPTNWEAATCDNIACHAPVTTMRDMTLPAAGETGSSFELKVSFYPNGETGTATSDIRIYDPADSARTVQTVTFEAISER